MDAIYMKLDTIEGDCLITGYEKQIELMAYSHGVAQQITNDVSNTNRTSGRPNHQDFTVTKYVDIASPVINQKCCEGAVLPSVIITVGRNDAGVVLPFIVYTLKDVVISSVSVGGGGGGKPQETVTLNYGRIQWDYTVQAEAGGKTGSMPGMWNLATNKAE